MVSVLISRSQIRISEAAEFFLLIRGLLLLILIALNLIFETFFENFVELCQRFFLYNFHMNQLGGFGVIFDYLKNQNDPFLRQNFVCKFRKIYSAISILVNLTAIFVLIIFSLI